MTDEDFLALEPPATLTALASITDEAERTRLRLLYARRRGKLVDGMGERPARGGPTAARLGPFKDPRPLGAWARWLSIVAVALAAGLLVVEIYAAVARPGGTGDPEVYPPATLLVLVRVAVNLVCGIVILTWVYNANANARRLGATRLRFSPGWSVGGYFVPFASLVIPFLAMRDLWRWSVDPARRGEAWLLGVWWAGWLTSNMSSTIAFEVGRFVQPGDRSAGLASPEVELYLAGDAGFIIAGVILIRLMAQIQAGQLARHRGVAQAEVFA